MTREDLIWKIEHGDDIMFDVHGRHFTILTWYEEGINIGEQNKAQGGEFFQTAEELLNYFLVEGVPLKDMVTEIVITDYTLVRE